MKGRGLNSIPIRFALITAVLATLCVAMQLHLWLGLVSETAAVVPTVIVSLCAVVFPTVVTWAAAARLTGQIRALRTSTEAIVSGDFDSPVEVDCACEVGGLADSFRKMVGRLNSNILRMNVLAYNDALTGLPNRIVANHMLGHMTAAGRNAEGAVIFIDLDGFKKVNDMLGHEAGDELLRKVSLRIIEKGLDRTPDELDTCTTPFGELCERAPEDIVVFRFAADEFVALLPGETDLEALEARAASILAAIEEPVDIGGNRVTIGASIGIVRTPVDSASPDELLRFADLAMCAAKEAGRSGFRFFDRSMRERVVERNRMEDDLRRALADGVELTLHYQPKLDCRTLECVGVEALARWNHPTRGMISPATFIPLAEAAGLMPALGASVLRIAARQCREWLDAGKERHVALNVSPAQFENPALADEILAVLREFDVDPRLIELEITESILTSDFETARSRVLQLQDAGMQISIDDFGIGFSNLSQLAKLPFDALKIDRSLIADIGSNPKSEQIVKAIMAMANALDYRTIAEGIEEMNQLHFLQKAGCDKLQGFLFARPMPAEELDRWEGERTRHAVGQMQEVLAAQWPTPGGAGRRRGLSSLG